MQIKNPDLREELLTFPHGEHDDLVDATVFALYWLMQNRDGNVMKKRQDESVPLEGVKDSFYVEEVRPGVFMAKIGEPAKAPLLSETHIFNYDKE